MPHRTRQLRTAHDSHRRQEAEAPKPPLQAQPPPAEDLLEELQRMNPDEHVSSK